MQRFQDLWRVTEKLTGAQRCLDLRDLALLEALGEKHGAGLEWVPMGTVLEGLTSVNMTARRDALEKLELIACRPNLVDRRSREIQLTARGWMVVGYLTKAA